jgi:hypothetical protein
MRPGMSCSVEILIEELEDALYVPVQAVFTDGGASHAFVDTPDGPERRAVVTGSFNDLWVQVVEGLEEGETVLLKAPVGSAGTTAPESQASATP